MTGIPFRSEVRNPLLFRVAVVSELAENWTRCSLLHIHIIKGMIVMENDWTMEHLSN